MHRSIPRTCDITIIYDYSERIHNNITIIVFISIEIEVILYTVDDTTFGKSNVCMYNIVY